MAEGGNKMKAKTTKAKKGEGKEKVDKMVLVKRLIDKVKKRFIDLQGDNG